MTGCMTHKDYVCPLGEDGGQCVSMQKTYEATRYGNGSGISVFKSSAYSKNKTVQKENNDSDDAALPLSTTAKSDKQTITNNKDSYLYSPPQVIRTYITAHLVEGNEVMGSHYVYWVVEPGYWQVPHEKTPKLAFGSMHPYVMENA